MTSGAKADSIQATELVPPWLAALHLATLFHFAVAQPIFDRLNERLSYCRDLNLPSWVVYVLVILLSAGCPLVIVLAVSLTRWISAAAEKRVTLVLHGLLWGLLALPLLKVPGFLPSFVIYFGAITLAGSAVWGYARLRGFRSIVTLCSIGIVLFPVMFLSRYTSSVDGKYAIAERMPNATSPPVVMIVFDEFCGLSLMTPEREIDADRFPNFAQLARDGHWFRNTASVYEVTAQAVPAILSGQYPSVWWSITLRDRPQNLFSMLVGSGGYDYAAFEPVTRLAPEGLSHQVMTRGLWSERIPDFVSTLFRVYLHHLTPETHAHCLPQVPKLWFGVRMEGDADPQARRGTFRYRWSVNRDEQWEHFLRTIDGAETPTVHFMHMLLPHVPWNYLPSGRRLMNDSAEWELEQLGQESDGWTKDELHSAHAQQRYLLQLMYTDKLLGQMIAKLRETGMYDRAMIVVTADHGISFRPGEYRRATEPGNRDEIQSVPLIIKRPGEIAGKVHDRPVEAVDILPTLAEALGYRLTLPVSGRSIFHDDEPFRSQRHYGVDAALSGTPLSNAPVEEIAQSPAPMELFRRFGRGSDPGALFRLGPIPDLVGRKVDSLPQVNAPPLTVAMSRFADVWPTDQAQAVPGFYEGQVLGHNPVDDPPVILAVAVNGVIRCVTRTYLYAAALSQWSAIVPESAYHPGPNDVRCYQILGQSPDWMLTPCELRLPTDQDS